MRGSIGFLAVTYLLLSACATIPPSLRGDFTDLSTIDASTEQFTGAQVRWGGVVTGTRATDSGECAEVGWYPLERLTTRPELGPVDGAYGNPNVHYGVFPGKTIGIGHFIAAPRFLACGEAIRDHDAYFPGAVVTFVGTIAPAKIYQVSYTDCVRPGSNTIRAAYSGTVYAANGDQCVVSLPTLRVVRSHGWKEQPWFDPNSSSVFRGL